MDLLLTSNGFIAGIISGIVMGFSLTSLFRLLRRKKKLQDIPFYKLKETSQKDIPPFIEIPMEQIISEEKVKGVGSVEKLQEKLRRFKIRNSFYTDR